MARKLARLHRGADAGRQNGPRGLGTVDTSAVGDSEDERRRHIKFPGTRGKRAPCDFLAASSIENPLHPLNRVALCESLD